MRMSDIFDNIGKKAKNIVDKVKDFFGLGKSVGQNTVTVSNSEKRQNEAFINKLRNIEDAYLESKKIPKPDYDSEIPTSLGLEKKTYTERPETAIISEAKDAVKESYETGLENLDMQRQEEIEKLSLKEAALGDELTEDAVELGKDIESNYETQQSKMIRQGLVNSSINAETKNAVAKEGEQSFKKLEAKYDEKYQKLFEDRKEAEEKYIASLESYELKAAAAFEKKVSELKSEESKRLREINDYNRSVDKQETEYLKWRAEEIKRLENQRAEAQKEKELQEAAEAAKNGGMTPAEKSHRDEIYNKALGYYDKIDVQSALSLIPENTDTLRTLLGSEGLNKLINYLTDKLRKEK